MSSSQRSNPRGQRRARRPAFAIVLLIAFMAVVFWFIIERQLGSAEERRLRLLAGFADRVEATVGDLGDRFGQVVARRSADQVEEYLNLLPQVEHIRATEASVPAAQDRQQADPQEQDADQKAQDDPQGQKPGGQAAAEHELTLLSTGPDIRLSYRHADPHASDGGVGKNGSENGEAERRAVGSALARLDLESVIEPMIIPGVFDSIVLSDVEGEVLYQHGEPELRVTHLDGLLGGAGGRTDGGREELASWKTLVDRQGGDAGRFLLRLLRLEQSGPEPSRLRGRATTLFETSIADSDHTVFLQPVTLRLSPLPDGTAPEPIRWIAVGVISSEHLLSAGVTTSPILLFLLVSILPLGLVAWPFLKLALISRRQPLTRLDVGFLVVSCVLALSFGALLLFDALFVAKVQDTVDGQLEQLSETIHRGFRLELFDAYRQLEELNDWVEDQQQDGNFDLRSQGNYFDWIRMRSPNGTSGSGLSSSGAALSESPEARAEAFIQSEIKGHLDSREPRIYPHFDSVFWPDEHGNLDGANLPLRAHAVLPQDVSDRPYFQCAKEWEDSLTLKPTNLTPTKEEKADYKKTRNDKATRDASLPDGPMELCLQSFLDRATGEAVTALSIRGPESWRPERSVAALVTRLTSVTQPVLPPQIHFAIVDRQGQVLFHSDSRRALTEDFLKATDEDRLLQSLIRAERAGHLPLHYWGSRNRAYVRPVDDLPWTLVVFRSMDDLRLRNFELIYDFLNPFVLSLLLLGALLAGIKLWKPRQFRDSTWPTPRHQREYRSIVWWTLLVVGLVVVLLLLAPGSRLELFWAAFLVMPGTVLFVVGLILLKAETPEGLEWLKGRWSEVTKRFAPLGSRLSAFVPGRWKKHEPAEPSPAPENREQEGGSQRSPDHQAGHAPRGDGEGPSEPPAARDGRGSQEDEQPRASAPWWRRWTKTVWDWRSALTATLLVLVGTAAIVRLIWWEGDLGTTWLALVFAGLGLAYMRLRFAFAGERRKHAYIFTLGCLLTLTLLPTLTFFHLARSRQVQFLSQASTVELARAVRERRAEIDQRKGPLETYYESYEDTLACTRDSYLRALFGTELRPIVCGNDELPSDPESGGDGRLWPFGSAGDDGGTGRHEGLMHRTFSARPLALNDLSAEPSGVDLSRFDAPLGDWAGLGRGPEGDRAILYDPGDDPSRQSLPVLVSTLPSVHSILGLDTNQTLLLLFGLALLAGAPFFLAWLLARKLLLIDLVYYGEGTAAVKGTEAGKDASEQEAAAVSARGKVAFVRQGEALEEALEEALGEIRYELHQAEAREDDRSAQGSIKRLVLISGQLQREAWGRFVAPRPATDPSGGNGGPRLWEERFRAAGRSADAQPPDEDEDEPLRFWEARFREAWKQAEVAHAAALDAVDPEEPAPGRPEGGSGSRAEHFAAALVEGAEERQPLLLTELDPELEDPVVAADQTDALRHLIEHEGRSVVILAETVPARYPEDGFESPEAEEARARWVKLLGAFPVRYARDAREIEPFERRLLKATQGLDEQRATPNDRQRRERLNHWRRILRTIREECGHTQILRQLGQRFLTEFHVEKRRETLVDDIEELDSTIEGLDQEIEDLDRQTEDLDHEGRERRLSKQIKTLKDKVGGLEKASSPESEQEDLDDQRKALEQKRTQLEELRRIAPEERQDALNERNELVEEKKNKEETRKNTAKTKKRKKGQLRRIDNAWAYGTLLTERHLITRVGAEARLHYRHLWSQCSRDEKLVLVQLAHHGIVNPKYSGWVLDLMQKGLVLRAPDVRIMNRSFARFVRQEARRSQILDWQEELGPNAWSLLKWILPFPLLALAGFLFITQRDAVSNAAGILVALVSLTPVVFNLYEKFQEINLRQSRAESDAEAESDT